MEHLSLLATLAILFVNLWGLALLAGVFLRNRWMALVAGPWLWTTLVFAVESYHGLGRIWWLGWLTTLISAGAIWLSASRWLPARLSDKNGKMLSAWRDEFHPGQMVGCLGVLAAIFLYALAWRFAFPDVDGSSEKLADLSYIASYQSGETIPVRDAWLHPYLSTHYYSFQHYAAALMGRMLGLPVGTTYNLAFCLLIGLGGTAFAGAVVLFSQKLWVRILVIMSFVVGGSGVTGFVHLVDKSPHPWSGMRFIGSAPLDREPLGPMLKSYVERFTRLEMPGEPFSYSIYLGDYHAPLASYYLLGMAGLGVLLWQRRQKRRYAVIVGATFTWTLLSNSWGLPILGLVVMAWVAVNWRRAWFLVPPIVGGAAAVWLMAWVYLAAFTLASSEYKTSIKLVPWDEHAPPLVLVMFLLPTIVLALLGVYSGRRTGRILGLIWLGMVVFSEFVYVDDVYSGMFNRFNTTLKWWPWIAAGTLMTMGPFLIEQSPRRWVRIAAIVMCAYPCLYAYDLGRQWFNAAKPHLGKIEGTQFLNKDLFPRLMLARMKLETPGVVIERPTKDGFTNSACLPLFAGHRMWLGWMGHEQLWHGYREDIPQRQERLFQFFNAEMKDPAQWLDAQGIDYVLWYQLGPTPELSDTAERWEKINQALSASPHWRWCEIFTEGDGRRVGFWRRAGGVSGGATVDKAATPIPIPAVEAAVRG